MTVNWKENYPVIFAVVGILFLAVAITIFVTRKKDENKNTNSSQVRGQNLPKNKTGSIVKKYGPPNETYIQPKNWTVGMITDQPYHTANLCNDQVLYPIQDLSPNYGSKVSNNCSCTEFIQSP